MRTLLLEKHVHVALHFGVKRRLFCSSTVATTNLLDKLDKYKSKENLVEGVPVDPPKGSNLVLGFDTEYSDLSSTFPRTMEDFKSTKIRPASIGWAIVNGTTGKLLPGYPVHKIVKPIEGYEISEEATEFHGISHDMAQTQGQDMRDILAEFFRDIHAVRSSQGVIVGHNVIGDVALVLNETERVLAEMSREEKEERRADRLNELCGFLAKETRDTMLSTSKWRKLGELFGDVMDQLKQSGQPDVLSETEVASLQDSWHNAAVDAVMTSYCHVVGKRFAKGAQPRKDLPLWPPRNAERVVVPLEVSSSLPSPQEREDTVTFPPYSDREVSDERVVEPADEIPGEQDVEDLEPKVLAIVPHSLARNVYDEKFPPGGWSFLMFSSDGTFLRKYSKTLLVEYESPQLQPQFTFEDYQAHGYSEQAVLEEMMKSVLMLKEHDGKVVSYLGEIDVNRIKNFANKLDPHVEDAEWFQHLQKNFYAVAPMTVSIHPEGRYMKRKELVAHFENNPVAMELLQRSSSKMHQRELPGLYDCVAFLVLQNMGVVLEPALRTASIEEQPESHEGIPSVDQVIAGRPAVLSFMVLSRSTAEKEEMEEDGSERSNNSRPGLIKSQIEAWQQQQAFKSVVWCILNNGPARVEGYPRMESSLSNFARDVDLVLNLGGRIVSYFPEIPLSLLYNEISEKVKGPEVGEAEQNSLLNLAKNLEQNTISITGTSTMLFNKYFKRGELAWALASKNPSFSLNEAKGLGRFKGRVYEDGLMATELLREVSNPPVCSLQSIHFDRTPRFFWGVNERELRDHLHTVYNDVKEIIDRIDSEAKFASSVDYTGFELTKKLTTVGVSEVDEGFAFTLHLSFRYDEKLKDFLKTSIGARFRPNSKTWYVKFYRLPDDGQAKDVTQRWVSESGETLEKVHDCIMEEVNAYKERTKYSVKIQVEMPELIRSLGHNRTT